MMTKNNAPNINGKRMSAKNVDVTVKSICHIKDVRSIMWTVMDLMGGAGREEEMRCI